MSGLQISDRLRQQLASQPCRDEALARDFETGAAITHRARQSPPSMIAKMAAAFTRFAPRTRRQVDADKARQRRRKWGGSSSMPDTMRPHYTEGERAALAVIAEQVKLNGFCDIAIEAIAEAAGVSRSTTQNAIRKARSGDRADIAVQLRPRSGQKNLTNIIRIISRAWLSWLKRSIGFKRLSPSESNAERSLSKSQPNPSFALEKEDVGRSAHSYQPTRAGTAAERQRRSAFAWAPS